VIWRLNVVAFHVGYPHVTATDRVLFAAGVARSIYRIVRREDECWIVDIQTAIDFDRAV